MFERYVSLAHPDKSKILLKKNRNKILVSLIWLYNLIMIITGLFLDSFGYDPDLEKCDFLSEVKGTDPRKIFFPLGFGVPAVLIVFSYIGIWRTVHNSSTFRKQST